MGGRLTFRAVSFGMSAFFWHTIVVLEFVLRLRIAYRITPKRERRRNAWWVIMPHLVYAFLVGAGIAWGWAREGFTLVVWANALWASAYLAVFLPFVAAGLPWRDPAG
jgi:hypothetical protein